MEAFLGLAATGQRPSFSLLFLGAGNLEYRQSLERTLASAPPEWRDAVRFVHFDPSDFSYLGAADIVVHPSVLPDPFPNAVREAMILGKPVIASREGGIPEMIQDGETGILIRPRDSNELADAMRRLVASADERTKLGEAAKAFAIRHFDINARKESFAALFRSLVGEHRYDVKRAVARRV
jgi:glycosyltransferase involved in cell wall biosynthesis